MKSLNNLREGYADFTKSYNQKITDMYEDLMNIRNDKLSKDKY